LHPLPRHLSYAEVADWECLTLALEATKKLLLDAPSGKTIFHAIIAKDLEMSLAMGASNILELRHQ
jgi:hypothetical protein